jgi:hypothetical protein
MQGGLVLILVNKDALEFNESKDHDKNWFSFVD